MDLLPRVLPVQSDKPGHEGLASLRSIVINPGGERSYAA
jgi:hypothetical protein